MSTTVPTADPVSMLGAVLSDIDQIRAALGRAISQAVLLDEALADVDQAIDAMRTTVEATRSTLDPS